MRLVGAVSSADAPSGTREHLIDLGAGDGSNVQKAVLLSTQLLDCGSLGTPALPSPSKKCRMSFADLIGIRRSTAN